jgi:hypothetical protein
LERGLRSGCSRFLTNLTSGLAAKQVTTAASLAGPMTTFRSRSETMGPDSRTGPALGDRRDR